MVPFIVLVGVTSLLFVLGRLGVPRLRTWPVPLRGGVAAMFLVTAAAHFLPGREDLVRMVPPALPAPELLVTVTGLLELAGAAGILLPRTSRAASVGLALLLAAMFPANVHAGLEGLTVLGRPATPLVERTILQAVFVAAVLLAGHRGMGIAPGLPCDARRPDSRQRP